MRCATPGMTISSTTDFPVQVRAEPPERTRCGIDKMGPIVTRGLLLDVAAVRGGPLADGTVIGVDDLEQAARAAGGEPAKGDVVLIRTGWAERQSATVSFEHEPGIDAAAALWLAEREVAVVGADNFAVEVLPFAQDTVFPVHQRLIRDFGVPLLEGLVLQPLARPAATASCLLPALCRSSAAPAARSARWPSCRTGSATDAST